MISHIRSSQSQGVHLKPGCKNIYLLEWHRDRHTESGGEISHLLVHLLAPVCVPYQEAGMRNASRTYSRPPDKDRGRSSGVSTTAKA